ncbi:MAG: hypothetical protein GWN94_11300, partial [Phycisphaerae bacterium]|nr:hypothetical protein [Phycisphaerae bacterium]
QIANDSIAASMMLANSIDSAQYVDNSIDMKHLSPGVFQVFGDYNEYSLSDTTSYTTIWQSYFVCPNDPTSLKLHARCKKVGGNGGIRLRVNAVAGTDKSIDNSVYERETPGAVD